MKKKLLLFAVLLCAFCFITGYAVVAQGSTVLTEAENDRIDSLKVMYDTEERSAQKQANKESLSDLKAEKSDTKMKAKEARRIERDANDAARESSNAYRSEKKAQKTRQQADKQAKKAAKARGISNEN